MPELADGTDLESVGPKVRRGSNPRARYMGYLLNWIKHPSTKRTPSQFEPGVAHKENLLGAQRPAKITCAPEPITLDRAMSRHTCYTLYISSAFVKQNLIAPVKKLREGQVLR